MSGTARRGGAGHAAPRAWQRMLSGRRLNLLDPSPLDIEIRDIAHGLARVARWNGQTLGDHPYSVAQHSLLVEAVFAGLVPTAAPCDKLAALLHDAAEYVVGDLISPFKSVVGAAYRGVETRITDAVHLRFSVPADADGSRYRAIKLADGVAAHHEAVTLAGFSAGEAERLFGSALVPRDLLGEYLVSWPTATVQARFLQRFEELDRR